MRVSAITDMLQHWVYHLVEFRHKKHWLDLGKDPVLALNTHCLGLPGMEWLENVPTSCKKKKKTAIVATITIPNFSKNIYLF